MTYCVCTDSHCVCGSIRRKHMRNILLINNIYYMLLHITYHISSMYYQKHIRNILLQSVQCIIRNKIQTFWLKAWIVLQSKIFVTHVLLPIINILNHIGHHFSKHLCCGAWNGRCNNFETKYSCLSWPALILYLLNFLLGYRGVIYMAMGGGVLWSNCSPYPSHLTH